MGCCSVMAKTDKPEDDPEVQEVQEANKEDNKHFDGAFKHRKCRDVLWLLLYIAFWVGMGIIAEKAFRDGNPFQLLYGVDSFGNVCGQKNEQVLANQSNSGLDLTDRPYLYDISPTNSSSLKLCVPACPSVEDITAVQSCTDNLTACTEAKVCLSQSPYNIYPETTADDAKDNGCPEEIYNTISESTFNLYRRCIPFQPQLGEFISQLLNDLYESINNLDILQNIFSDFSTVRNEIAYLLLISLGICLVVMILMRCLTAPMVYASIIGGNAALIACCYFSFREWDNQKAANDAVRDAGDVLLTTNARDEKLFLGLFIFSVIVASIIFLLTVALRNRIRLTVSLFEEASKVISHVPWMLVTPLITYIWLAAAIAYWVVVLLYLSTSKTPTLNNNTGHVEYVADGYYQGMWWYHLFGVVWATQFFIACEQIVLAGTVASFYFTREHGMMTWPFLKAVWRLIRYHLGSAAAGSLIIALVVMARIVLAYIQRKFKGEIGPIGEFFLKCLQCCLWCFEKCLKFLNKNAYIEIAIYGYSFCTAARQAFSVLVRNIVRVAVINLVGGFILFVMKLMVVAGTAVAAYIWLAPNTSLHYWALVVLAICIVSWFISDIFIGVYDMTVDTLFICFAEDSERNDGSSAKPYFASKNLQKFMADHKAEKGSPTKIEG